MAFEQEVQHTVEWAQKCYEGEGPEYSLMPMFFGFNQKNQVMIVACPWGSEEEKYKAVAMVSAIFAAHDVDRYVMAVEAWMATVSKDTPKEVADLQPSQREDRTEILQILGVHKDGTTVSYTLDISRDEDGRAILGEPTPMEYGSMSGIMTKLLDAPPMPEAMKEAVKKMGDRLGVQIGPATLH